MPNTFQRAQQICNISATALYTCPSTNTNGNVSASVVILLQAANVTSTADLVTIYWTNSSNSNQVTRLAYQVPVPAQQSIGVLTGKLVLYPGDVIYANCATFQAIELSFATLETS